MRSLISFVKKEVIEQIRTGKLVIMGILCVLFGIMNPAIALLTPWLLETFAESMQSSGLVVTATTVTALDSWMQFYKNVPMLLIAFVLFESNIFTKEYETGTLVLSLTKGLKRYKVVTAKTLILYVLWTIGYWMSFGITYVYNAYYWDNSIAKNLMFSVGCWWIFGLWVISLMVLFSVMANSNAGVLVSTGGVVLVAYLISMVPKLGECLPTMLASSNALIYQTVEANKYFASLVITVITGAVCTGISIPIFNKKKL